MDWNAHRAHRNATVNLHGQWVGIFDRDWQPVMDIQNIDSAEFQAVFAETGNMTMEIPGELEPGLRNPVVDYLLTTDLSTLDDPRTLQELFHSAVHIVVERKGAPGGPNQRRAYRVLELSPEGGRDHPEKLTITGVDLIEFYKHLPLWADPSNRSKVVQLSFSDKQSGTAEEVTRKLIMRNLLGYFQPSLLQDMFSWTEHTTDKKHWSWVDPNLHPIMFSPIPSGLPSEKCIIEARWDNAFDLLRPTWQAAGLLPIAELWLPGDSQPFPEHTTLSLPTVILSVSPRATESGAIGLLGQGWRALKRTIDADNISSVTEFSDVTVPTRDGRAPWVVFDLPEGPKMAIRKSLDWRFLIGGKSPKVVNEVVKATVKTGFATLVSMIPLIGPPAAELIKGGVDIVANLTADRFLNINEYQDKVRKAWHGRSSYVSLSKAGEANTHDSLQKAWQAKTETAGGIGIAFDVDDLGDYVAGRDFQLGDTIGVHAWGTVWAAFLSEDTWTSTPEEPLGIRMNLGNFNAIASPEELFEKNVSTVRAVISRLSTAVNA